MSDQNLFEAAHNVKSDHRKRSANERSKRYRMRKHIEKYGPNAGSMIGRHGNHARGNRNGRWAGNKLITSHGYVAVRVPVDHPHAWGPPGLSRFKYAYEHIVVMMSRIGRPLHDDEIVHHKNGVRTDNRIENLLLMTAEEHQRYHSTNTRERDSIGRFAPEDLCVREMPTITTPVSAAS